MTGSRRTPDRAVPDQLAGTSPRTSAHAPAPETSSPRHSEPSAEEGLADVRVIRALYRSAELGEPVELPAFRRDERPSLEQEIRRPPVEKPDVVHAQAPSGGS